MNEDQQQPAAKITAYLDKLAAGICPHCGKKIEGKKQVGRTVCALPCYHRLYQGTI